MRIAQLVYLQNYMLDNLRIRIWFPEMWKRFFTSVNYLGELLSKFSTLTHSVLQLRYILAAISRDSLKKMYVPQWKVNIHDKYQIPIMNI